MADRSPAPDIRLSGIPSALPEILPMIRLIASAAPPSTSTPEIARRRPFWLRLEPGSDGVGSDMADMDLRSTSADTYAEPDLRTRPVVSVTPMHLARVEHLPQPNTLPSSHPVRRRPTHRGAGVVHGVQVERAT